MARRISVLGVLVLLAAVSAAAWAWAATVGAPSAQAAPISCAASTVFVAQNRPTQLFTQVYGSGATTFSPVGPPSSTVYNALGFNPLDNYLYAIDWNTARLVRIENDGSTRDLGAVAGLSAAMLVGAFGPGGQYWVTAGTRTTMYTIDVATRTATPLALSEAPNIYDWTYANGYLWGTSGVEYVRVDPATGQVTRFPATLPAASYGAAWTYGNGDLGFSNNTTGDVTRVRVSNPASASPTFAIVSTARGPATADNDGASCAGPPADLEISKAGSQVTEPGGVARWTVTVRNNGPGVVSGFTVTDIVPAGATSPSSATPGCDVVGGDVVCVLGPLGAGRSAQIGVSARMPATTSTCVTNTAQVASNGVDPNPANDEASFESCTRDPLADVRIAKTADAGTVLIGGQVRYTLTVVNDGPDPAENVLVGDMPAIGVQPISATPSQGACTSPTSCQLGTLAPGASATIVVVARATGLGSQGNTASVTSATPDPDPSNNTATTTLQVEPLADLSIVKRVSDARVREGETFTYTLTVRNGGPSTARGVVVTDSLPAGLRLVSVRTTRGGCAAEPVVCTLGDLADGAEAAITITVRAAEAGSYANSAAVTSSTPDPDPSNNHDGTRSSGSREADLSIVKRASSEQALVGAAIVYTLSVRNNGPTRALDVVVTDALPAGLQLESVTSSAGSCAATPAIVCELGTLSSGRTETVTVTATVLRSGVFANGASITSPTPDPDPSDNTSTTTIEGSTQANLSLDKTASASTVPVGGTVVYGIVVVNRGPNDAASVAVSDPVPAGASVVSARPSTGSCTVSPTVVSCLLGDLANGASATIRVEVVFEQAGSTRNAARVTSPTPDPDPSDNGDETEVTGEKADLSITKRASSARPALGGPLTYAIVVVNNGPDAARGVVVTDTVPDGFSLRAVSASGGACATTTGVITCELGDVAAGARETVTVTGRATLQGRVQNSASVLARVPSDPDGANNTATATVDVRPGATRLKVDKRASRRAAPAGGTVRYRIAVTNAGRRTAHGVRVCDRLPRGLAYVSHPGARLRSGQACWTASRLAPGERRVYRVVARVLGGSSTRLTNVATAKADNARPVRDRATVRRAAQQIKAGGVTG